MQMKILLLFSCILSMLSLPVLASYERNKAVPVQQVIFGQVESIRSISEEELIEDESHGWKTFGGALIGGAIGNQFGGGSGRTASTVLGALIGANIGRGNKKSNYLRRNNFVELLIRTENSGRIVIIQELDATMQFVKGDDVRLIYLTDNSVRVDRSH